MKREYFDDDDDEDFVIIKHIDFPYFLNRKKCKVIFELKKKSFCLLIILISDFDQIWSNVST